MDDYALVLNAGSSSLKFCVFQRPSGRGWRLEARGQVDGIGSDPRLTVKDEQGPRGDDGHVDCRDAGQAIDTRATWLRARYQGSRVLGIGHRVVHGGARFTGPTV